MLTEIYVIKLLLSPYYSMLLNHNASKQTIN